MKIIELQAENVKRLRAVDITPDGTLQVIGGRNAQGKSSVLDAVWLALGGGKAAKETPLPIRDGEDKASVRLDLGDLVVTRSWTQKGTTLRVENADGATYSSPQSMLDGLVGQLSFDPLAFTRLSAREQKEALLGLVDLEIDLPFLESKRAKIFADRTEVGRQGSAIGDVAVDESLPLEETSATEIIGKIQEIQDQNREHESAQAELSAANAEIERIIAQIKDLEVKLEAANVKADSAVEHLKGSLIISTGSLQSQLATIEDLNAQIRANNTAREAKARKDALRDRYEAMTREIEAFDAEKAKALKTAKFPVKGLSFDESGVLYQGMPLSQASSAEQIRVSLAMGMALNPKLRVLMIKDGSLLDDESMAAIREQVAEKDYQLLIERVGNADQGAVIIEDGMVA